MPPENFRETNHIRIEIEPAHEYSRSTGFSVSLEGAKTYGGRSTRSGAVSAALETARFYLDADSRKKEGQEMRRFGVINEVTGELRTFVSRVWDTDARRYVQFSVREAVELAAQTTGAADYDFEADPVAPGGEAFPIYCAGDWRSLFPSEALDLGLEVGT